MMNPTLMPYPQREKRGGARGDEEEDEGREAGGGREGGGEYFSLVSVCKSNMLESAGLHSGPTGLQYRRCVACYTPFLPLEHLLRLFV